MQDAFKDALGRGEVRYHWMHSMEQTELFFVQYETVRGLGCVHYVGNMFSKCAECGHFFGCAYCHEASIDLNAEPHDFKPSGTVKCLSCGTEQPFAKKCSKCDSVLYEFACQKCGFSSTQTAFFHCDRCGQCVEGSQA